MDTHYIFVRRIYYSLENVHMDVVFFMKENKQFLNNGKLKIKRK